MALHDQVIALREKHIKEGSPAVPNSFQNVTKEKIAKVLNMLDRAKPDIIDVVFALLDDTHSSWFSNFKDAKFCDGASTAHLGSHVGLLQRGGMIKLDREGRDYWIKPLRELGIIDPVYLHRETNKFIPGHPVPKSGNSAYKLNDEFKSILQHPDDEWRKQLSDWIRLDKVRERLKLQARLAKASMRIVDTKHKDLIRSSVSDYAPRFLPEYVVIYTDIGDGDRITDDEEKALKDVGITLTISDAMPDVLLINKTSNSLWVIEAVTSDGEVDLHKVTQLTSFSERCGFSSIGFTTTYRTWRELALRQHKHKNINPDTYIWVQEDGSKQFKTETY